MDEEDFEVIFETRIRYVRPKSGDVDKISLVLSSLSIDDVGIRIYKYMCNKKLVTPEELIDALGLDADTVLERLDYMYSLGLIDKLGKAYIVDMPLSRAIRKKTSQRITEILEHLARILNGGGDE
mgnify:CR=1 FL=1